MTVTLTYTNADNIARLLRGRAEVDNVFVSGSLDIDHDLINQKGQQVEARVNAQLSSLYVLPLSLSDTSTQRLMASIVEKLIVCELLPIYYPDLTDITSSGGGGQFDRYAANMCKLGQSELQALLSSAITLEGETLAGGEEAVISKNVTVAGRRTALTDRSDAGAINW